MADTVGFENREETVHKFTNTLDGNVTLDLYADCACGLTAVLVNGTEILSKDAGAEIVRPFYCGKVSLPRGVFTIEVKSGVPVGRFLLGEKLRIDMEKDFDLQFANRGGQWVFSRPQPDYTPEVLELLKRHGFVYEKTNDCAVGEMPSGIPLGGFGCGKLEIGEDGMFTAFTGNNNQDSPIFRMPGSFLAFAGNGNVRILRKDPLEMPYTPMAETKADFVFPFARLTASDPALPFSVTLDAFSPHIPGNAHDSALPCVFLDVTMENTTAEAADAKLCFSWENIINVGGSMNVTNHGERIFPLVFHASARAERQRFIDFKIIIFRDILWTSGCFCGIVLLPAGDRGIIQRMGDHHDGRGKKETGDRIAAPRAAGRADGDADRADAPPEQEPHLRKDEKRGAAVLPGEREIPDRKGGSDRIHPCARRRSADRQIQDRRAPWRAAIKRSRWMPIPISPWIPLAGCSASANANAPRCCGRGSFRVP